MYQFDILHRVVSKTFHYWEYEAEHGVQQLGPTDSGKASGFCVGGDRL